MVMLEKLGLSLTLENLNHGASNCIMKSPTDDNNSLARISTWRLSVCITARSLSSQTTTQNERNAATKLKI